MDCGRGQRATDWVYNMDFGINMDSGKNRGLRTKCSLPAAVNLFNGQVVIILRSTLNMNKPTRMHMFCNQFVCFRPC